MTVAARVIGPRLAARVVLFSVGTAILVTVLAVGMVYVFLALDAWLAGIVGKIGALVIIGVAGLLMVAVAVALGASRSKDDALPCRATLGVELVEKYPIESAALALAAGLMVSNVDIGSFARPVLAELARPRR